MSQNKRDQWRKNEAHNEKYETKEGRKREIQNRRKEKQKRRDLWEGT